MSLMEYIVRPFQSPSVIVNTRRITTVVPNTPAKAVLTWGGPGQGPTITVTGLNIHVKTGDVKLTEKIRTVTNVRIQNPTDPSQFVVEERPNTIAFVTKDAAHPTSQTQTFTPSPSADAPTGNFSPPIPSLSFDPKTGTFSTTLYLQTARGPNETVLPAGSPEVPQ